MNLSRELVAASSIPMVLSILSRKDSYGYEIIGMVNEISSGGWLWSEGMLYPILHKLENGRWISSYWVSAGPKRRRKYYHLEEAGRQALVDQKAQWLHVYGILSSVWPEEG